MIVAIDGPAGAGKSTVARRLAERLGFHYLDTGAMYRALTWLALQWDVPLEDETKLGELARAYPVTFDGEGEVWIGGNDVTKEIREPRVDKVVSMVARHPAVREVMRERQRELGHEGDSIIEGRDIGTVVAPDAEVKVYLVADEAERARRRVADRPGIGADALATDLRHARRARCRPDAARRGRRADRHDRPRRSTRSSSGSSSSSAPASRRSRGRRDWRERSPWSAFRTSASRRSSTG